MRSEYDEVLDRSGGVASRDLLVQATGRSAFDNEVARGRLVAVFPRAYARPWDADQLAVRRRAALVCAGTPAALSHLTALQLFMLPAPDTPGLHVTTLFRRHPRGATPGLVVHRTRVPTKVTMIGGLATVTASYAIVRAWPLLPHLDQRAPAIEAVRRRLVTPAQLRTVNARTPGMPGRARLAELIGLLEAGCESELEIWGLTDVFAVPGLNHARRQREFMIRGQRYRCDLAYEVERVGVELDGERFHSSPDQRERDRRKDAAFASIGWVILRFGFARLHQDVSGCRRDAVATLASRRAS